MTKINVLHTEWSDGWGGQEIRIISEMIALREKGISVFLACRNNSTIKQKALEHGIKIFILPFSHSFDFVTLFKLLSIIKKEQIHIVNTHSGIDTWVGGIAAKLAKVKFIRTRHLSNPINPSRLNFINELADFIFTTGEQVKIDMINNNRIDPSKIESIPTGVNTSIYNKTLFDINKEKISLKLSNTDIAIGILAVLRSFKRHDIFIEVASVLLKRYSSLKFFIAGDGPQREKIEQLIQIKNLENKIILLGHQMEPARFLSALDLFVLTSDSKEGVPQSVMQALLMELPVIATDVGSTRDLYINDNFLLIPPNDILALVSSLEKLIEDESLRKEYTSKARTSIIENFSLDKMAEKIYNIYLRILSTP